MFRKTLITSCVLLAGTFVTGIACGQEVFVYRPTFVQPVYTAPVVVHEPVVVQRPIIAAPVPTVAVQPVVVYRPPVVRYTPTVEYVSPIYVRPKVYIPGRPIYNILEAISP